MVHVTSGFLITAPTFPPKKKSMPSITSAKVKIALSNLFVVFVSPKDVDFFSHGPYMLHVWNMYTYMHHKFKPNVPGDSL